MIWVVTMTTVDAPAAVSCRSAGEVPCHLSTTGTWKKLSHLLLAAVGSNACDLRSVCRSHFTYFHSLLSSRNFYPIWPTSALLVLSRVVSLHNWRLERAIFDPHSSETPRPILMKLEIYNYLPDATQRAKFQEGMSTLVVWANIQFDAWKFVLFSILQQDASLDTCQCTVRCSFYETAFREEQGEFLQWRRFETDINWRGVCCVVGRQVADSRGSCAVLFHQPGMFDRWQHGWQGRDADRRR